MNICVYVYHGAVQATPAPVLSVSDYMYYADMYHGPVQATPAPVLSVSDYMYYADMYHAFPIVCGVFWVTELPT